MSENPALIRDTTTSSLPLAKYVRTSTIATMLSADRIPALDTPISDAFVRGVVLRRDLPIGVVRSLVGLSAALIALFTWLQAPDKVDTFHPGAIIMTICFFVVLVACVGDESDRRGITSSRPASQVTPEL